MSAAMKYLIFRVTLGLSMAGPMLLTVLAAGVVAIVLALAGLVAMIGGAV